MSTDPYTVPLSMIRWLFATFHLLALGIGLGAIWMRASALRSHARGGSLRPVFTADNWWIVALSLWLVTGLVRAIAGLEKPGGYYLYNDLFWLKMGLAALLYTLELWPMAILIQWGIWLGRGRRFDTGAARRLAVISYAQVVIVVAIVLVAVAMARGFGVRAGLPSPP